MTDLLVKLYDLPEARIRSTTPATTEPGVRRCMASEKRRVVGWVDDRFGDGWASECDVAFARQPIACLIALEDGRLVGFACYDSTRRNFFGPIGIDPGYRQRGIGRALLLATLRAMADVGYAYAIIGGAGPTAFFEACLEVFPIPLSTPGIYHPPIESL